MSTRFGRRMAIPEGERQLNTRVPWSLYAQIRDLADVKMWTIQRTVVWLLRKGLDHTA